jgi:serine protein kinase
MNRNGARSLVYHLQQVNENNRRLENAFQSLARMIIEKVIVNGKSPYDFQIFSRGSKHVIGMFDEINSFVSCAKDAAEGGSSREMAFVLVGEPGNGKTFFVETLCALYRRFLGQEEDRCYTFNSKGLDRIGIYGKITTIQSQTFEDRLILATNLMPTEDESKEFLARHGGFEDSRIDEFYRNHRPLGAGSSYISRTSGTSQARPWTSSSTSSRWPPFP